MAFCLPQEVKKRSYFMQETETILEKLPKGGAKERGWWLWWYDYILFTEYLCI